MSILYEHGYFYSSGEQTTQSAADEISEFWLSSLDESAYKDITLRWSYVLLSSDGSGIYYTMKHPDDACNITARAIEDIQEGDGDEDWLPQEDPD